MTGYKTILTLYYKNGELSCGVYDDKGKLQRGFAAECGEGAAEKISAEAGDIDCVVCPGGVLKPLKRGLYSISDKVLADAGKYGSHPYNGVMAVAAAVAKAKAVPAFMLLPMSTDELLTRNRISSNSRIEKKSRYFALEHAALIDNAASEKGAAPEDGNYIVAYIDDLVSVGAHMRGFCIDVNDMIGQEGPMGLTSSGDVPCAQLAAYVSDNNADPAELAVTLTTRSGLLGYTGTSDPAEIDALEGADAELAIDAMVYQVGKWIGLAAMDLQGKVDAIILGGKAANSEKIVNGLTKKVCRIGDILVIPEADTESYMAKAASAAGTFVWPVLEY